MAVEQASNASNPAGRTAGKAGLSPVTKGGAFAAVAADESRAAEVGRDILANGGNAVDAAVAMYFAMAVTLPSAGSLGAAGACIVHDAKKLSAESFVFAPVAGASALSGWQGQTPAGSAPSDSGGFAGFVAVDSAANAVACTLSMGQLFGARMVIPGTGILLGAPTPEAASTSPVIVAYPSSGEFVFAGAGGGAPTAAQATGAVARATVEAGQRLSAALAARRGQGGYVNAIVCPSGLRGGAATCESAIDPAGAGLALVAN